MARLYKKDFESTITPRNLLKLLGMRAGKSKKKAFIELITGYEFSQKLSKWIFKIRRIDKENDRYTEIVTDQETNNIIHYCDHPLSEHQGHGSAKNKKHTGK